MRLEQFSLGFHFMLLSGQRPADNAMKKLNRHSCLQRKCSPLHSQISFCCDFTRSLHSLPAEIAAPTYPQKKTLYGRTVIA
ncbi:apelin receptor early endogenous ligand [Tenrec ecaudatus]|uniref:apelin receptor early endogenous ligand n=1 Tax=Tenrec ecaudatus TaxID=94439 RepID=UPI003F59CCF0